MTAPRRLLSRREAAAYCSLSVPKFREACQVKPVPLGVGARMERYDQRDLDAWIDRLKGAEAPSEFDRILESMS